MTNLCVICSHNLFTVYEFMVAEHELEGSFNTGRQINAIYAHANYTNRR